MFYLNTLLIDTVLLASPVRNGGFYETLNLTLSQPYQYWTLQHDLIGTILISSEGRFGGTTGSTTTSFQTTAWSPTNYCLLMSNLNQTNFYLLTDLTRALVAEVETTYLLTHLLIIPVFLVLEIRYSQRY